MRLFAKRSKHRPAGFSQGSRGCIAGLVLVLSLAGAAPAEAANCASKQSGNWSVSGTWKSCGGGSPQGGDTVTITDAVTLNTNTASLASLTVAAGGSLNDDGVGTRRLQLAGPLSNSGTINLYTNASQPSYVELQADSTWSGNGTLTADYIDITWRTLNLNAGDTLTLTLKNSDPLRGNAFNAGSPVNSTATVYLNRNGAQSPSLWGTVNYPNLRIGGSGTKSISSSALTILGSLTIDGGATFSLGSNYVTATLKGDINNGGTFGPGLGTWTFNGTAAQTISSSATFQTLTLNNSAGLTLGGDLTLGTWGSITLQAGRISTGSNKVVVPSQCDSAWLTRASGTWINGNLSLTGPSWGATCVFHVGDATNYAPINFTYAWHSAPLGGVVVASTAAGDHADTTAGTSGISATKSVNRTWTLTQSSGTYYTFDATFQFCNGTSTDCGVSDVDSGVTTSSFMVAEKNGGTWTTPTTSTLTSTSSKATGMTAFGTFAVGEATPVAALAYYAMDETTWNGTAGEVVDSSGNNHHGRAVGSAGTVSGGYVCRGGDIPSNTSDGTQSAVDTGLDVDSAIGSKGTIAFWYKSKTNWNGGSDRTLFDASSSTSDKYFSLLLDSWGRLVFALEDSGDEDIVLQTSQYSYTSSDWVHIAVTWDMPGDRREIYVNGTLATTNTDDRGSTLGNLETLYIGDNRGTYHPEGSPNSANGTIDEVYIYNAKLAKAQIQAAMNASHTCPPGTTTCTTFRDEFSSTSYSRNDGTANWTASWIETGDNSSASSGTVQVTGNQVRFAGSGSGGSATFGGPSIEREANLSGANVATLTFDYSQTTNWESSDVFDIWVSKDGGSNWTKIHSIVNDSGSTATQSFSYDVSAYIASNFRVAFAERMNSTTEYFYLDNVQIEACSANIDHVRIEHSGAGVTCVREPVTIKACKDADCTAQYTAGSVSLTLAPTGGWYSAASGGTASDALSFTGSATRYFERTATGTYVLDASSVSPTPANGVKCYVGVTQTCNLVFSDAGFIVWDTTSGTEAAIPAHTGGTASKTYYLRAVKADKSTKACEAALTGANTVNFGYECLDPGTCYGVNLMNVNGGTDTTISRNNSGSVGSFTSVAMTFDANGSAPFTFNYSDVGKVKLHMAKAAGGSLLKALSGSTNDFIVKPSGFVLSDIKQTASPNLSNPGAADASGAKFVKAGEAFSATVTAKAGSGTAYSFGRESTPEEVTLSHALVVPSGGEAGTLSNATIVDTPDPSDPPVFTNGVATVTNLAWSEVGIIQLTPGNSDYLGAGAVTGTTSGNVGRFFPDHFSVSGALTTRSDTYAKTTGTVAAGSTGLTVASAVGLVAGDTIVVLGAGADGASLATSIAGLSGTTVTLAAGATSAVSAATVYSYGALDAFTYMGEPMLLLSTVKALDASGNVTKNYSTSSGFAKLGVANLGLGARNGTSALTSRVATDSSVDAPLGTWTNGVGSFITHLALSRPTSSPDASWGPYEALQLGVAPTDSDGVTITGANLDADISGTSERVLLATTVSRYGRVRLLNANGSELLDLPMAMRAEYWAGMTAGWQPHSADTKTTATLALSSAGATNITAKTCVRDSGNPGLSGIGCAAAAPSGKAFLEGGTAGFAGNFNLWLQAPGAGSAGAVGVTATVPGWLQYPWASSTASNPVGRATFGVFKSGPVIHRREMY